MKRSTVDGCGDSVGVVKTLTVFRRQYLKTGTKKLITMRLVPAGILGS